MISNSENRKASPGDYSNGTESFHLRVTGNNNIMIFKAITNIEYLEMKKGESISLLRETVESLLNDEFYNYILDPVSSELGSREMMYDL